MGFVAHTRAKLVKMPQTPVLLLSDAEERCNWRVAIPDPVPTSLLEKVTATDRPVSNPLV